jgi:hypothetical protein
MDKTEQVKQELEKVIREMAEKEGLSPLSCRIEASLTGRNEVEYLIEYMNKDGHPAGLGFRNIRPVNPEDFNDPKFLVRLIHNLALWLKAQAAREK